MKVYVDELPKGCESCPFYLKEHCVIDSISFLCPLEEKKIQIHFLPDYTKQVRKEMCDKIYNLLTTGTVWRLMKTTWSFTNDECEELRKLLDKIQGEIE